MKQRNLPKRLFFLFLVFTILAIGGMVFLMNFGLNNPDNVTPEFFTVTGRIFGGLIGFCFFVSVFTGIAWIVRALRAK